MARLSRDESRQQTRERILAAAAELFAERGVNGASIEQIAERAGYSRGAVYGNFADKDELAAALLALRVEHEEREVSALRERADSLPAMLDLLRDWNRDRGEYLSGWFALRLELLLHAARNEEFRASAARHDDLALAAIGGGVREELARSGAPAGVDPDFLALIVHAVQDGLLIQRLLRPDEVGPEAVVDAVDLLLRSWHALAATDARADLDAGTGIDTDERTRPT